MRIIQWVLETGFATYEGRIEVEDNATDEEIDAEVRGKVFNWIEWGWHEVKGDS